eukprot:COSAG04_NODE_298_length_17490_cov_10.214249_12_plen_104_part_00
MHKLSQLGTSGVSKSPNKHKARSKSPSVEGTSNENKSKRRKRRGSLVGSRSATGLWEFLASRLKVMARMRMEWGTIHEERQHAESIFVSRTCPIKQSFLVPVA